MDVAAVEKLQALTEDLFDRDWFRAEIEANLTAWRDTLLSDELAECRNLLQQVLLAPLTFTPEGAGYRFTGQIDAGPLFGDLSQEILASPAGFEPASPP